MNTHTHTDSHFKLLIVDFKFVARNSLSPTYLCSNSLHVLFNVNVSKYLRLDLVISSK